MAWSYEIRVGGYWSFTDTRTQGNIIEVWNFFGSLGFTEESVSGILGNMWRESHINPGQKQGQLASLGWGLIQWTPSTVLTGKVSPWYDGAKQCDLINKEGSGFYSGYWLPTSQYPYSWEQFSQLRDIDEATKAYCFERERAGTVAIDERIEYARKCFEVIAGRPPTPTTDFPLWLFGAIDNLKKRKLLT